MIVGFILGGLTLNAITFLSTERYYSVCHPLHYQEVFNRRKIVMVSTVLVSPTVAAVVFLITDIYRVAKNLVTTMILVETLCCAVAYYKIFQTVRQTAAQRNRHNTGNENSNRQQQDRALSKKLLIVVVVILLCYTPYAIVINVKAYSEEAISRRYSALYISLVLLMLNSLFNPVLFVWLDSFLRKQTIALLKGVVSKITC